MPRASKKKISKTINLELKEYFASLISGLKSKKQIEEFMNDFLTPEENLMLAKRLLVYMMFENKYPLVTIESILGVSDEMTRVHKNKYAVKNKIFHSIIHTLAKKQRSKQLWKKIEHYLKPIDLMMRSKNDMKARAKLYSGELFDDK